MSRLLDVIAPPRLGRGFRLLWRRRGPATSATASPWPRARCSSPRRPTTSSWWRSRPCSSGRPHCSSGCWAGALTDRLDRRLIIITVDLLRAVVLALLAAAVAFDAAPITLVLVAMFLLGTAEVFADNTAQTLLPMLVEARRPGHRQRPAADRLRDDQPARRAADRRPAVHGRPVHPVRDPGDRGGPGRGPDLPPAAPGARPEPRRGPPGLARHRRGLPLDLAPRRGPHAGADDPDLQRHVRGRLVGARPLRHRAPRPGQCRVRAGHHRRRGGRPRRHRVLRVADPPDQPRQHHARGADHRDLHPSRARRHVVAVRRHAGLLRLRRARLRLGHHLDHDPPARGADRAPGPGRVGEPGRVCTAGSWSAPRSAG